MHIINRKTHFIFRAIAASMQETIVLPFKPTHVIVRNVIFVDGGSGSAVWRIMTDLVPDITFLLMTRGFTKAWTGVEATQMPMEVISPCEIYHPIIRDVNGTYDFRCVDVDGLAANVTGTLGVQLEFVQME